LSERTLAHPAGSGNEAVHEGVQKTADERTLIVETVGSVCWLAMDAGWMLGWRAAATALIAPCLLAHLLLFRSTPRTVVAVTVTASMNGWLAMNAAWMLGDIWAVPALLAAAKVLCATATALLVVAFSRSRWRPEARLLLFAGFRRLRLAFQPRPKR
jgi:hypothetical protein